MRMIRILLLASLCAVQAAQAATLNRWVQMAPDHKVLLRVITDEVNGACPVAAVDGTPVTLTRRGNASGADSAFPVTMCEASVPVGGTTAMIDGVMLHMPLAAPRRIIAIGDTGCRLAGKAFQACNDPSADGFPFAAVAQTIASFSPDLIIHVGDYYYREATCPQGNAGCAGVVGGDNWTNWNSDWFTPARAMMAAAPLALARGNHETCGRGGRGWYALMDPRPYDPAAVNCKLGSAYDYPPSYIVDAGAVSLIMFDSSYANTGNPASLRPGASFSKVEDLASSVYTPDLAAQLAALGNKPAFFVTHRPAYGVWRSTGAGDARRYEGGAPDEQAMFASGVPAPIKLLLSGHIHQFEAVQLVNDAYAPQLVVGMGGTALDSPGTDAPHVTGGQYANAAGAALAVEDATVRAGEYGFAVLDRAEGGYTVDLYYLNGIPHGHCFLQTSGARKLSCDE